MAPRGKTVFFQEVKGCVISLDAAREKSQRLSQKRSDFPVRGSRTIFVSVVYSSSGVSYSHGMARALFRIGD